MKTKNILPRIFNFFCWIVLIGIFFLNLIHIYRGDIVFHTDIARDFLVMEEIIQENKPTLIGPKSGGVSGVFHGPAWYYLNLPVFYLSGGNPAIISIFWLTLYLFGFYIFYLLSKKVLGCQVALASTTLLASLSMFMSMALGQQSPSFFLSIVLLYFVYSYLQDCKWWQVSATMLVLGFIIQFQMAFGGPMLLIFGPYLIFKIIKTKKYSHLLALGSILIPLSTFILFDLRHDFLQSRSVMRYFSERDTNDDWTLIKYANHRFWAIVDCFSIIKTSTILKILTVILSLMAFVSAGIINKKSSHNKAQQFWFISLLMITGFWLITIPFRGEIQGYYYESLLPVICLWFGYAILKFKNKVGVILLSLIICFNFYTGIKNAYYYLLSDVSDYEINWSFYSKLANDIFKNTDQEFGYYVFTTDQFGYQAKYAMNYYSKNLFRKTQLNKKAPITYLIIGRNDYKNPFANEEFWQKEQVRIDRVADDSWEYQSGYKVLRYNLSEEELLIESDPNLIEGLHFR